MFSSQHVLDGLNKRFMDYPISEVLKDCVLFFFFFGATCKIQAHKKMCYFNLLLLLLKFTQC